MAMIENFVSDTEKFTLDGVSSDTLGLFCDFLPPMPMAEQIYSTYNTGADEQLTSPDKVFNDIRYTIRFYTFLADDYNDAQIKAFCANKSILTLSRFPGYFFKIRKISLQAFDGLGYGKRIDYVLTLTLAPFRYVSDNPWIQLELPDDNYIINTHTRYSKPLFEITGSGICTITVQGKAFDIYDVDSNHPVVIDSERHITYSGNTLWTGKTDGAYPLLNIGDNSLGWNNNVTGIKYKGNWRDL